VRGERCAEKAACRDAGRAVDHLTEARVVLHVRDPDGGATLEHLAGDAFARRQADVSKAFRNVRIARDVREVELVACVVEKQHRYAVGGENLSTLGDYRRDELAHVEVRRKSLSELVQELEVPPLSRRSHLTRDASTVSLPHVNRVRRSGSVLIRECGRPQIRTPRAVPDRSRGQWPGDHREAAEALTTASMPIAHGGERRQGRREM